MNTLIIVIGVFFYLIIMAIGFYFYNNQTNSSSSISSSSISSTGTSTTSGTTTTTTATTPTTNSNLVLSLINAPSTGASWTDSTKNGNNGAIQGTFTYSSNFGGGWTLPPGSYISTNYNINTNNFTVSMVFSATPASYWSAIWANETWNAKQGYFVAIDTTNVFSFYTINDGQGQIQVPVNYSILAAWDFVYSGISVSVYKNGSLIQSFTRSLPTGGFSNNGLYFGARHSNSGSGYTDTCAGTYYMMNVYSIALSADQISSNFNSIRNKYSL